MDYSLLVTAVAVPILVSFATSFLVNQHQKKLDFVYDYRKYILNKRKEVYNQVEELLMGLSMETKVTATGEVIHDFAATNSSNPINDFKVKLANIICRGYWLSDECLRILTAIDLITTDMSLRFEIDNPPRNHVIAVAVEHFPKLAPHVTNLIKCYYTDICELDDIRKFKSKKLLP